MDRILVRELSWVLVLKLLVITLIWQLWFSTPPDNVGEKMGDIIRVGSVTPSLHNQEVIHDQ